MATPTTIVEFVEQKKAACTTQSAKATEELGTAGSALADAVKVHAAETANFAKLQMEEAQLREELKLAPTKADGDAKLAQLQSKIVELRASQFRLLEAWEGTALAEKAVARAQADASRTAAALAQATSEGELADAAENLRTALKKAASEAPLKTLKSDAMNTLASAAFTGAKTRIDGAIPAKLIERARQREDAEALRMTGLLDRATGAAKSLGVELAKGDESDKAASLRMALDAAVSALKGFVESGGTWMSRAVALLAQVPNPFPLTAEESGAIVAADTADAAQAATREKERDDERANRDSKKVALDQAILAALVKRPLTDPASDAAVGTAKTNLATAVGNLASAETAFTANMRKLLDSWESAVPDTVWHLLAGFQEAERLLTRLSGPSGDSVTLVKAVVDAEKAYAAALDKEYRATKSIEMLASTAGMWAEEFEVRAPTAQARSFSSVRGDG